MEFDLENPLTSFKEHQSDTLPSLFASESDHMPSLNLKNRDFDISFRQEAITLILQAKHSLKFDPFIPYLAVNYMDRFMSRQEMPQGRPWVVRLIVISCLSLASKMKNTELSLSDFQREEGFIFDAQTIQRMELLILTALNWRMRSVTPFSFLYFFISLFELKDPPLTQALKDRARDIIFTTHHEVKLLEFKPSIIAASALLSASHELFPLQFHCFNKAISSCEHVNKEQLLSCYNIMEETIVEMDGYESSMFDRVSSTKTPISVLDMHRHYINSGTENVTTSATATAEKRDVKRRKVNGFCTYQLSQIQQC
nr:D-type cyclin CYCD6;1 [Paeonia suffruticosa]